MSKPDPTAELLAAMADYGLYPKTIKWDRSLQRFPGAGSKNGKDDSGWYRAFPDQRGAVFGCHRTGVEEHWQLERSRSDDFDPERWARLKKKWAAEERERREQQEAEWKKRAAELRDEFLEAPEADPEHPYLAQKGISHPEGIRMAGGKLLIPMKGIEAGNPLWSIQYIDVDGDKRFAAGGRVSGTRTTVGMGYLRKKAGVVEPGQSVYVAEGWATAWTVAHTMEAPCLCAFTANNLKAIATYVARALPTVQVVVAADNDRWSLFQRDGKRRPNPGVILAREAADAAEGKIVIPEFASLDEKPTDFNDLYMREGLKATRRWLGTKLDPLEEGEQEIVATPSESGNGERPDVVEDAEGPEQGKESPAERHRKLEAGVSWLQAAPFRIMGHDRGTYYFLPDRTGGGQLREFSSSQLERKSSMFQLAPLQWWREHFPSGSGVGWTAALDALIQVAHRIGVFNPDQVRGLGAWPDETPDGEQGTVLHLGDRLFVPGSEKAVDPESHKSPLGYYYERRPRRLGPATEGLDVEQSARILDTFTDLLWNEPASGRLLAGWVALAPICGALDWRPHVWLVGERGCGKSTVVSQLVMPLLGDMDLPVHGETTEAGIRGWLKQNALPVTFDEAEESEGVGNRIQKVLALARQSSTETEALTLKGTQTGGARQYSTRSMFLLASIGGAIYQEADKSRFSLLQLRGDSQVSSQERAEHWERFEPKLLEYKGNRSLGRKLIRRTWNLWRSGMLPETVMTFRRAAGSVMGDQRRGDQYGTLLAGAWSLEHDDTPDPLVAREMIGSEEIGAVDDDSLPEGLKALSILMQQLRRVETSSGPKTLAVGELVDVAKGEAGPCSVEEADRVLGQLGIKVDVDDGAAVLYVANTSEWVSETLRGTIYHRGVRTVLRSLAGAVPAGDPVRFHGGLQARATKLPYRAVREVM